MYYIMILIFTLHTSIHVHTCISSYEDVFNMLNYSCFQGGGFLTALEYSDKRKMCFRVGTGSQELE